MATHMGVGGRTRQGTSTPHSAVSPLYGAPSGNRRPGNKPHIPGNSHPAPNPVQLASMRQDSKAPGIQAHAASRQQHREGLRPSIADGQPRRPAEPRQQATRTTKQPRHASQKNLRATRTPADSSHASQPLTQGVQPQSSRTSQPLAQGVQPQPRRTSQPLAQGVQSQPRRTSQPLAQGVQHEAQPEVARQPCAAEQGRAVPASRAAAPLEGWDLRGLWTLAVPLAAIIATVLLIAAPIRYSQSIQAAPAATATSAVSIASNETAAPARAAPVTEVELGVSYIEQLEDADTSEIEDAISANRQDEIAAQLDAAQQGNAEGLAAINESIWGMFQDYAILGDSRAVGFSYFGFLDEGRVLASGGETIADIPSHYDQLKALDPSTIYLCFGLNDISIGYWNTPDEYTAALGDAINGPRQACPRATIYVNSTLLAHDPAFETSEKWRSIPDWNVAVKAWCASNNVPYIDNDALCDQCFDMWDSDGIHVWRDFYPYWANNMLAVANGGQAS